MHDEDVFVLATVCVDGDPLLVARAATPSGRVVDVTLGPAPRRRRRRGTAICERRLAEVLGAAS